MKRRLPLRVYSAASFILITGRDVQAEFHSHHALQISLSLDKEFYLEWEEKNKIIGLDQAYSSSFAGAIIDADVKHRLDGDGGELALILIDPEFVHAKKLKRKLFEQSSVSTLPQSKINALRDIFRSKSDHENLIRSIHRELFFNANHQHKSDPRIDSAIEFLKSRSLKSVSAGDLAAYVNLSESRLSHLFKFHVGIPLRRYLMWLRLMDALAFAMKGNSLTESAHHSGFADSAHFSRTFQSMFGISPSAVVKYSEFIQVNSQ